MDDASITVTLYGADPEQPADSSPLPGSDEAIAETLYSQPEAQQVNTENPLTNGLNLSDTDSSTLAALIRTHGETPADDAQSEEWEAETNKRLIELGVTDHDIDGALRLVKRNPEFAKLMKSSALGNNIDVMQMLVEQGRHERLARRL